MKEKTLFMTAVVLSTLPLWASSQPSGQQTYGDCSPTVSGISGSSTISINCSRISSEKIQEILNIVKKLPKEKQLSKARELVQQTLTDNLSGPLMSIDVEETNYKRSVALFKSDIFDESARLLSAVIRNVIFERAIAPKPSQGIRLAKYYVFASTLNQVVNFGANYRGQNATDEELAKKAVTENDKSGDALIKGTLVGFSWADDKTKIELQKKIILFFCQETSRGNVGASQDLVTATYFLIDALKNISYQSFMIEDEAWLLDQLDKANIVASQGGPEVFLILLDHLSRRHINDGIPVDLKYFSKKIDIIKNKESASMNKALFKEAVLDMEAYNMLFKYSEKNSNEHEENEIDKEKFLNFFMGGEKMEFIRSIEDGSGIPANFWLDKNKYYNLRALNFFINVGTMGEKNTEISIVRAYFNDLKEFSVGEYAEAYNFVSNSIEFCTKKLTENACLPQLSLDYYKGGGSQFRRMGREFEDMMNQRYLAWLGLIPRE